jgi:hypothetical protein
MAWCWWGSGARRGMPAMASCPTASRKPPPTGEGDTSIPLGGSSPRAEETPAMTHSTAPVGPPVDGPPQPPKPDAALPPSTHTARP